MQFPRELIPALAPRGLPPERFLGAAVSELAESIEEGLIWRSYIWSIAIMNAGFESRLALAPRLSNYATGFVQISGEDARRFDWIRNSQGFSFGANILIESGDPMPQVVLPLEIGEAVFPVVVNFGEIEGLGLPTNPHTGTGTCWIENQNHPGPWQTGVLSCRHTVASLPPGSAITFHPSIDHSSALNGVEVDRTSCTIDATVISITGSEWPGGLSPVRIGKPVAPGQPVAFQGGSTNGSSTVLRTFQHSNYIGNLFGQHVFTDCHGAKGDNGSLFFDPGTDDGPRIYMDTIPDGSGRKEGLCQHLAQAALSFGLSTLR